MIAEFFRLNWVRLLAAAVLSVFLALLMIFWLPNPHTNGSGVVVTIPRGTSFQGVVDSLERAGAIRSAFTFKLAGRLLGYTKQIKVGKYLFAPGTSNFGILKDIREGKSRIIIAVSIPEGVRLEFVINRLSHDLGLDSDRLRRICADSHYIAQKGLDGPNLEGYLLPDTYSFYWQTDEKEVIDRIVNQFTGFYSDSLRARQQELHSTMREIITLASIVEAESRIDSERAVIAGVYWNRLRKGMRLEADPTIQYTLPNGPRRLRYRDLDVDNPYNTYRHYGLPPGPINNPGRLSILATLFSDSHSYLYFVATGRGGHRFSKSYADHQRAIILYKRERRLQRATGNGVSMGVSR